MEMNEYQKQTEKTVVYPRTVELEYLIAGLVSEVGEIAGTYKKHLRGDFSRRTFLTRLANELGDVLWYTARLTTASEYELSQIAERNLEKLQGRLETNTIKGDDREPERLPASYEGHDEKDRRQPSEKRERVQQEQRPFIKLSKGGDGDGGDSRKGPNGDESQT